ncbi:rho gtpase-activating protein 68f [Anaeramoeba flamelloides]|uniref:Rho gtpase-activating protein 68f n=1 Tax=Anaeramoeba flamelloides TaxID=1746091 RepID=A0ABQ8XI57_9EUKA|nr:rho gtpase-activating protein 68f [Anaeramoeba flamelloides]
MSGRFKSVIRKLGKKKNTFGKKISSLIPIHPLVQDCVEIYKKKYATTPVDFTGSSNKEEFDKLVKQFEKGTIVELYDMDPLILLDLLKHYFKSLPEPVLTFEQFDSLLGLTEKPEEEKETELFKVLDQLPNQNRILLDYLLRFLKFLLKKTEKNNLTIEILVQIWKPLLLWKKTDLNESEEQQLTKFIRLLIEYNKALDFGTLDHSSKLTLDVIGNIFIDSGNLSAKVDLKKIHFGNPKLDNVLLLHEEIKEIMRKEREQTKTHTKETSGIQTKLKKLEEKDLEVEKEYKEQLSIVQEKEKAYNELQEKLNSLKEQHEKELFQQKEKTNKTNQTNIEIKNLTNKTKEKEIKYKKNIESVKQEINSLECDLQWHEQYIKQLSDERNELTILYKKVFNQKKEIEKNIEEINKFKKENSIENNNNENNDDDEIEKKDDQKENEEENEKINEIQKEIKSNLEQIQILKDQDKAKQDKLNSQRDQVMLFVNALQQEKIKFEQEQKDFESEVMKLAKQLENPQSTNTTADIMIKTHERLYLSSQKKLTILKQDLEKLEKQL